MGAQQLVIVMEEGAQFPRWMERADSAVVIVQHEGESLAAFERRSHDELVALAGSGMATGRAILVTNERADGGELSFRRTVTGELVELVRRAGGGQVVLAANEHSHARTQLVDLAEQLNAVFEGGNVTVTVRFGEPSSFAGTGPIRGEG